MSSTTQSIDYKQLGVQDVCEIKNYPYYDEEKEIRGDEEKGILGKTITRKIFEILKKENWNLGKAMPDLAYLAARNDGLDFKKTELGAFMNKLLSLANSQGVTNENIKEYMEGVVMAVYVFESVDDISLANKYLGCQSR